MKRTFAVVLVPLLSGCTGTIEYNFGQIAPELSAVAFLDQSVDNHTVYLSLSEGGMVKSVEDGSVSCYVNGTLVTKVTVTSTDVNQPNYEGTFMPIFVDPARYRQLPVSFHARFSQGDKVRLEFEVNGGAYKASTKDMSVPGCSQLTNVDTVRVSVQHLDWRDTYLQVRADVPDCLGEDNWFCICLHNVSEGTYVFMDKGPDIKILASTPLYLHDLDDPILLDGSVSQSGDTILFDYSGDGSFSCFSDQLFRNGIAHLKMNVFAAWSDEGVNFRELDNRLVMTYDYDTLKKRGFARCQASHWLEIHLSQISQEAYHYLRALRIVSSDGYVPEIVEPVTIPNNIIGGCGFVSIVNTVVSRIPLPDEELVFDE